MNSKNIVFFTLLAASLLMIGCGGTAEPNTANTNNNKPVVNSASANNNGNNPLAVTTPTPDSITNDAPTLTPVYKAYCAAVVKKDEALIRKFYTADTLKHFEEDMKDANIKTLSEYFKEDRITNETCEIANERFVGDKAVAKIKTAAYPNGFEILFEKENGEWKMSNLDPKTINK